MVSAIFVSSIRYGSPYSQDSINNPYGAGSPYSPGSPTWSGTNFC